MRVTAASRELVMDLVSSKSSINSVVSLSVKVCPKKKEK